MEASAYCIHFHYGNAQLISSIVFEKRDKKNHLMVARTFGNPNFAIFNVQSFEMLKSADKKTIHFWLLNQKCDFDVSISIELGLSRQLWAKWLIPQSGGWTQKATIEMRASI